MLGLFCWGKFVRSSSFALDKLLFSFEPLTDREIRGPRVFPYVREVSRGRQFQKKFRLLISP
jgi:hypothetical protein